MTERHEYKVILLVSVLHVKLPTQNYTPYLSPKMTSEYVKKKKRKKVDSFEKIPGSSTTNVGIQVRRKIDSVRL